MDKRRHARVSLDLLRSFSIAARHLSFTRAARERFVTQSAISHEIKTLEEQIGQPLFRRVNRGLELTHAGEELYRATEEALALIDATTERLARYRESVALTTTTALASLWLVPRLAQFTREHPAIDVRVAANNELLDLQREHLDLAIRYVPAGADIPRGELLVDYETFPVCAPAFLRERARALRTPADLAHEVLLDYETILYGRPWYDWARWFDGLELSPVEPAGRLLFSHYDQVIQAAIEGSGVAIGRRPHLTGHLQQGLLVAPFGADWVARLGTFDIVMAGGTAGSRAVASFVAWLKEEVRRDAQCPPETAIDTEGSGNSGRLG